jgi:hypothetical protein
MNILERLRSKSPYLDGSSAERTMEEAAEEIERLTTLHEAAAVRAEVAQIEAERLRAALRAVADYRPGGDHQDVLRAVRRALEHKV